MSDNPRILYSSDNETPAVMRLETLIGRLKESGVFENRRYRACEETMRGELASRGWYDNLNDYGHWLAINIDRLGLEPGPAMLSAPGAVHPELGGAPRANPPPKTHSGERSRFFEWFDSVTAAAAKTPVGAFMARHGYKVTHTGGGCLAWEKTREDSGWSVWIADNDGGLGDDVHARNYCVSLQHNLTGDYRDSDNPAALKTLPECVEWGEAELEARAESPPCRNHRDNGRGICCDCGAVLV